MSPKRKKALHPVLPDSLLMLPDGSQHDYPEVALEQLVEEYSMARRLVYRLLVRVGSYPQTLFSALVWSTAAGRRARTIPSMIEDLRHFHGKTTRPHDLDRKLFLN
jgi:hypothetical protein